MLATGKWRIGIFAAPTVRETKKNGPEKAQEGALAGFIMAVKDREFG